jgi:hypothetical protein
MMSDETEQKEEVMVFPCSFPIKIMGRDEPGFRETIIDTVEKHAGKAEEEAINATKSTKGNFVSITITIDAQSRDQLDAIYQDLTDNKDVLFAL